MVPKDSAQSQGPRGRGAKCGAGHCDMPGHCDSTTSNISRDYHQYLGRLVLRTLLCKVDTTIFKLQVGEKLNLREGVSQVSKLVRGGPVNDITSPDALLERWH